MTTTSRVNRIRERSSGILRLLVKAEIIVRAEGKKETGIWSQAPSRGGDAAPGFLDFLLRRGRDLVNGKRELPAEITLGKDLDPVPDSLDQTGLAKAGLVHFVAVGKLGLERGEVDHRVAGLELGVVETLLGKTTSQWHLSPLEARTDRGPGTGLLPLVAF